MNTASYEKSTFVGDAKYCGTIIRNFSKGMFKEGKGGCTCSNKKAPNGAFFHGPSAFYAS